MGTLSRCPYPEVAATILLPLFHPYVTPTSLPPLRMTKQSVGPKICPIPANHYIPHFPSPTASGSCTYKDRRKTGTSNLLRDRRTGWAWRGWHRWSGTCIGNRPPSFKPSNGSYSQNLSTTWEGGGGALLSRHFPVEFGRAGTQLAFPGQPVTKTQGAYVPC